MRGKLQTTHNPQRSTKSHSRTKQTRRFIRLASLALIASLVGYLFVNIGLAVIFTHRLTHPSCNRSPQPPDDLPQPEEHWLITEDGLSLRSWYYPTENGAAILVLGGIDGSLGNNLPPIDFLVHEGYGVLQIDTRACAQPPAAVTLGGNELYDAVAGLAFLQARPKVEIIGTFGFSMGGATAIRAAARHPEIAAVVAEGNYFNLGEHFLVANQPLSIPRRLFALTLAGSYWLFSGINPWQLSPIEDLPDISPRHIFLIYGEHEVTGVRSQAQFTQASQQMTYWVVAGGSHGANHIIAPEEYYQKILKFFDRALRLH